MDERFPGFDCEDSGSGVEHLGGSKGVCAPQPIIERGRGRGIGRGRIGVGREKLAERFHGALDPRWEMDSRKRRRALDNRRDGLVKKAAELSLKTGCQVGVVVMSRGNGWELDKRKNAHVLAFVSHNEMGDWRDAWKQMASTAMEAGATLHACSNADYDLVWGGETGALPSLKPDDVKNVKLGDLQSSFVTRMQPGERRETRQRARDALLELDGLLDGDADHTLFRTNRKATHDNQRIYKQYVPKKYVPQDFQDTSDYYTPRGGVDTILKRLCDSEDGESAETRISTKIFSIMTHKVRPVANHIMSGFKLRTWNQQKLHRKPIQTRIFHQLRII